MSRDPMQVDYDLVDRLTKESEKQQDEYIRRCPHLREMRAIAAIFTLQGWWETTIAAEMARIKLDPTCGLVIRSDTWSTCDECSGEINV